MNNKKDKVRIGIIGCGAIGEGVALFIDKELRSKAVLWALADKDTEKAEILIEKLSSTPKVLNTDLLIRNVDLVIETASVDAAKYILRKVIESKKDVIILSVGALVADKNVLTKAAKAGINIYIPSGAICGVDGLGALSLGAIKKVSITTSKPPRGLLGAQYLQSKGISLENLKKAKIIFKGSVEEAIKYFPQNINVAATLLMAASFSAKDKANFDERIVEVCIKADPTVKRNVHCIEIDSEEAKVNITIENVPSRTNPKTSALAVFSTQHLLKKIFSSFKIGS